MLYRAKDCQEAYIHRCADSHRYTEKALRERLQIYLHDVAAYTLTENGENTTMHFIKHCPYCGVEIAADEYAKERL